MKEEFFSKFIDYNNRLEKILETKEFSVDVKNLLLSMLYKIDISYSDYQTVKRSVKNKQAFLEDILRIVEDCEKIELVKPNSKEGIVFEKAGIKYKINSFTYEIKTFGNERVILEALFELDNTRFYLPEKYNLIRVAFPNLLNEGKAINCVEMIRDFNAWSWNILSDEISNVYANLIYQNLEMLIGQEKLEEWLITEEIEDKIEWLEEELRKENTKEQINTFLTLIYQISIDCCVNKNSLEKTRLLDEKIRLEEEYENLMHKEKYLEEITQRKKEKNKEIEKIDRMLNDRKLLKKEYQIRNQALNKYNKILNLEHFVEMMNKQRRKAMKAIEEWNHLLKPNEYLQRIEKIENELDLLKDIGKSITSDKTIEDHVVELEKIFLTFLKQRIKEASKKEMIEFVYKIRYYEEIPLKRNQTLGRKKELREQFKEIEEFTINKMQESKQVNKISEDKNFNIKVLRNIFHTKMIHLENLYLQLKQKENSYILELYDKEMLEKEIILKENEKEMKEFKIKQNKKIKVFI